MKVKAKLLNKDGKPITERGATFIHKQRKETKKGKDE